MSFRKNAAVAAAVLLGVCGCEDHHDHDHGRRQGPAVGHAVSCGQGHQHGETDHDEPVHGEDHEKGKHGVCAGHDHQAKAVSVTKELQRVMGLKTVRAESRRVASTVSFPGRYELDPTARQVVSSPVAGRLNLLVAPLAQVKKGDALFTVASPDLVARSREIEVLEKRLGVYREIKTQNAALANELALKRAERESRLAGAEERDGTVTVRATADGMVESLIAQDGAWLETGAAAIQIVRVHDLRFRAMVAVSDALRLKDGMVATVGAHPGRIRLGIGDGKGLVPVYVMFDGGIHALAGERSNAECVTDETVAAHTAVPVRCIVPVGLQPMVFLRDEHNAERFIAVPVTPGVSGGGWVAVEGLPAPDCEIVSEGAYELKLALAAAGGTQKKAGHFHADGVFHEDDD